MTKKRWPLWLKWGIGFAIINATFFLSGIYSPVIDLWRELGIGYLYYPAVLVVLNFMSDGRGMVGLVLGAFIVAIMYFFVGAIIGFIIQKLKNRKVVQL